MKRIIQLERFCIKCNKYVDTPTYKSQEDMKKLVREERCLTCHTKLTYARALYERKEFASEQEKKK